MPEARAGVEKRLARATHALPALLILFLGQGRRMSMTCTGKRTCKGVTCILLVKLYVATR